MTQAVISFGEHQDRILSIVKGKYGFRNKSQAINFVIEKFEQEFIEPELRPEYLEKLKKIRKGKYTAFSSVEELRKATS